MHGAEYIRALDSSVQGIVPSFDMTGMEFIAPILLG